VVTVALVGALVRRYQRIEA
jgi:hypothetical protein